MDRPLVTGAVESYERRGATAGEVLKSMTVVAPQWSASL
jgi:hypothetical protein